ncbi:MAG TPA: hypothetical protein VFI16_03875, partial [Anaeromyxobacteraceae bacterium]|nr:hypothetical protein [Anaeromyxobacteraceae bacterium]
MSPEHDADGRRGADALLLLGCCALAVALGVAPGQDASWDLRNYHFYNPHAWLRQRHLLDLAPAQIQSWLLPAWDLLYYGLARSGVPSWAGAAVLSLPAGVALFLLALVARRLAPRHARGWTLACIVAMGATAAGGGPVIGTTMSEWHVTALLMGALLLVLAGRDRVERRLALLGLAGLCAGAATGFKLTGAPYALGLAALVVGFPGPTRQRLGSLAVLGLGGLAGFLAVYGPWGWELYRRSGNPFFPFLNDVFRSPLWFARPYREEPFAARSALDLVSLPFKLLRTSSSLVSELPLRDARLALALPALAFLAFARRGLDAAERTRWRAVASMFVTSYLAWAGLLGVMRFAGTLELLAAAAIGVAGAALVPDRP